MAPSLAVVVVAAMLLVITMGMPDLNNRPSTCIEETGRRTFPMLVPIKSQAARMFDGKYVEKPEFYPAAATHPVVFGERRRFLMTR
jgi:hypothetical protein